ncbi:MAG: bifunctional phosphoglucose/phosphomannose isomerase [Crocinitomicaceae bacterium]|nr:bifunctional phosphoglucose/phosphomannose isomerase [Crocinitomicaceae bacterium]|tara:strand:- start:11355 stop:12338 length:984 start_codon:yes stop_codon:yes gene_type:complete
MRNLVNKLPEQIKHAVEIADNAKLDNATQPILNVCISGLGGSGIGGTIVSQLTGDKASIPIIINKDYSLPSFVNKDTLFIASSYSGNTEETLIALEKAQKSGAQIACITSGGKLLEIAKANNYNHIVIPGGYPPRSAFGYSSVQLFRLLTHYNLIDQEFRTDISRVYSHLIEYKEEIMVDAEGIADKLLNKIPIIYSDAGFEGIGVRFRQQINENSKMLCWHHVLPEMNHNELVAWAKNYPETAVVIFRNEDDFYRTQKRMEFAESQISKSTSSYTEIWSKGNSIVERAYYLIYLGDWVSVILAEKQGIDPVEVDVIGILKDQLADL